jgi:aminoglycoside phosphotransferase (APT) family kinase protein
MDASVAQDLIAARHPSFGNGGARLLGAGFDYLAFEMADADGCAWVFRFPRRAEVVARLEREIAWLPHVAEALRRVACVPEFAVVESADAAFPYPFVGYRRLPGRPLFDVCGGRPPPQRAQRTLGSQLAGVFRALHGVDLSVVPGATFPDEVGTPRSWFEEISASRALLLEALPGRLVADCRRWLDSVKVPPDYAGTPCLVHDDLGSVHVLVDDELSLCGLIDFGDIDAGDPAVDVAYVTGWLGPTGTDALLRGYGASAAFTARVRTVGVLLAMSWVLECLQVMDEPPQDFHLAWLRTALTVAR